MINPLRCGQFFSESNFQFHLLSDGLNSPPFQKLSIYKEALLLDLTTYAETEEQESDTIFIFQLEALWLGPPYKDSLTGHFNHSNIQSLYFFSIFWCSVFQNILSLHVLGYFGHSTFRISVGYSTFQNIPLFCHSVVA